MTYHESLLSKNHLRSFLESFETRFANLILVFLETSGSPMDPEKDQ